MDAASTAQTAAVEAQNVIEGNEPNQEAQTYKIVVLNELKRLIRNFYTKEDPNEISQCMTFMNEKLESIENYLYFIKDHSCMNSFLRFLKVRYLKIYLLFCQMYEYMVFVLGCV